MSFAPHGSYRAWRDGAIVYVEATGPFNKEIIEEFRRLTLPIFAELPPNRPQATILIQRVSAMATPEAIEETRRNANLVEQRHARVALAYVMGPDVEGREIMEIRLREVFADHPAFEIFETVEEATAWARPLVG